MDKKKTTEGKIGKPGKTDKVEMPEMRKQTLRFRIDELENTLLPMLIMLGLTLWAIAEAVGAQISPPPGTEMNYGVLFVALALFGLAVWLMVEGVLKAAQLRRERKTKEVTTGE